LACFPSPLSANDGKYASRERPCLDVSVVPKRRWCVDAALQPHSAPPSSNPLHLPTPYSPLKPRTSAEEVRKPDERYIPVSRMLLVILCIAECISLGKVAVDRSSVLLNPISYNVQHLLGHSNDCAKHLLFRRNHHVVYQDQIQLIPLHLPRFPCHNHLSLK
jgi:hypothetical protein